MLKLLIILSAFSLMGATSCSTLPFGNTSISPKDANRYEAVFAYNCDGVAKYAVGTSTCQYNVGDKMSFTVKVPPEDGEIQVRSCRHKRAIAFTKTTGEVSIEWVQFAMEDSCPIVFSVVTQNISAFFGKIYPYVSDNSIYPKLSADFTSYCFDTETIAAGQGSYACQYPTGIDTNITFTAKKLGKYLLTGNCFSQETKDIPQNKIINLTFNKKEVGFCHTSLAMKYIDGTYEEFEGFTDHFNESYRFLPTPNIVFQDDEYKVCAPDDYVYMFVGTAVKKFGFLRSQCAYVKTAPFSIISFDKDGRISVVTVKDKESFYLNMLF